MTCTGCHSLDGINEKMCMECPIRKCGQKQKLAHCAACKEYPCKHIETYVPADSENRNTLDQLSQS